VSLTSCRTRARGGRPRRSRCRFGFRGCPVCGERRLPATGEARRTPGGGYIFNRIKCATATETDSPARVGSAGSVPRNRQWPLPSWRCRWNGMPGRGAQRSRRRRESVRSEMDTAHTTHVSAVCVRERRVRPARRGIPDGVLRYSPGSPRRACPCRCRRASCRCRATGTDPLPTDRASPAPKAKGVRLRRDAGLEASCEKAALPPPRRLLASRALPLDTTRVSHTGL
jgi:hypothetical protein